ncbi:MAG: hypothetical protein KUG82_07080 [Pseudomonadales bacterium]|nr:hypothetical protein [Pseudomonadales bacterium]
MSTSSEKSPDIEIYVQDTTLTEITEWLDNVFDTLAQTKSQKNQSYYQASWQNISMTILVFKHVIKGYTSIWIDSPNSPWKNDIECARDAQIAFKTDVRCIQGSWEDSEDPDLWWFINNEGEGSLIWKTD